jgi:hypothetical protein
MDQFGSFMRRTAYRNLLRYAVGHAIHCPKCDSIMDATRAVYAEDEPRQARTVQCFGCWGRAPMLGKFGSVLVLDGRLLFPGGAIARRNRKKAQRGAGHSQ